MTLVEQTQVAATDNQAACTERPHLLICGELDRIKGEISQHEGVLPGIQPHDALRGNNGADLHAVHPSGTMLYLILGIR
jgi:hypothetical protein